MGPTNRIGSGKGQLAAVAIGALGGAFAGGQLGKSLDDVDRMKANQTQQTTLENNKDGVSSTWNNPNTGHSGRVTPRNTQQVASSGEYCRDTRIGSKTRPGARDNRRWPQGNRQRDSVPPTRRLLAGYKLGLSVLSIINKWIFKCTKAGHSCRSLPII